MFGSDLESFYGGEAMNNILLLLARVCHET